MKAALTSLTLCLLILGGNGIPARAKNVYYDQKHGYWYCHPYVKRGAVIGGGIGLGYEYLRRKGVFGNDASDNPNCN